MPSVLQDIRISTTPDGLLLLPASPTSASNGLKIEWRTAALRSVPADPAQHPTPLSARAPLHAHGILGLLDLVHASYLIAITSREAVATLHASAVYRVQDVALIPVSSKSAAEQALRSAAGKKPAASAGHDDEDLLSDAEKTDEDDEDDDSDGGGGGGDGGGDGGDAAEVNSVGSVDEDRPAQNRGASNSNGNSGNNSSSSKNNSNSNNRHKRTESTASGVVHDVIQQRGKYGRFAERWFSRGSGGKEGVRRSQGMSKAEEQERLEQQQQEQRQKQAGRVGGNGKGGGLEKVKSRGDDRSVIETLTPRILRSARLFFSSSGFYFAYDYDLTRGVVANSREGEETSLWKRSDALFFWNKHLLQRFTDAGFDDFALPVIQGFVGQREFSIARTDGDQNDVVVDAKPRSRTSIEKQVESIPLGNWNEKPQPESTDLLLTLISRRSTRRAGLRYLRRGIDEEGNVANNVETEQVLSSKSWNPHDKTFSLTQIRGSMPLFFKQSPYSFKPVPEMFGSDATNQAAFRKHFAKVLDRYGAVHAVSLVDKHGTENAIGTAYQTRVETSNKNGGINGKEVTLEWFDFHGVCKGMKFENVSLLLDTLASSMTSFSWTEQQENQVSQQQSGVFRTNCMDCLDRTNVVQSAIAGHTLQAQLATLDLQIDLQHDPKTQWFNTLWADNGDAISRQYAGTAALKGDFTRTRKRNWTGALSDFSLTLNRYYNNIFSDYFLQTCIDYYLGNVGASVFDDFETDMMSKDYALNMRHIRAHAIETCEKMVLENPEEKLLGAWTLSCPQEANTLRKLPFEECVLLVTQSAVYHCRMDWTTEKLESFERVELTDITEIYKGAYVTNAFGKLHTDENKNFGFVLKFRAPEGGVLRRNTRSLLSEEEPQTEDTVLDIAKKAVTGEPESRFLAFKALPPKDTATKEEDWEAADMSEVDVVTHICEEIRHTILNLASNDDGTKRNLPKIVEKDIVSAAEAKKSTGYVETIGYSLKKLVWS